MDQQFFDHYTHPDDKIKYLYTSIGGNEDHILGCQCEGFCTESNCKCISRSGMLYHYKNIEDTSTYCLQQINPKPFYECNENCTCQPFCGNRLIQFGPITNLSITPQTQKGLGLVTLNKINKQHFICEYAGEVISEDEVKKRRKYYKSLEFQQNYIFSVYERFGATQVKTFIDPSVFGNIGRYINHSCEPNCVLYPIRINSTTPKLCIFAVKDIKENTELTYNYGSSNSKVSSTVCYCGKQSCKGFLPNDDDI